MLAMAIGGHFLASADIANAAKQKAPTTTPKAAIAKPAANKPPVRKPVTQNPITQKPTTQQQVQTPAAKVPVRVTKPQKPKVQDTHFHNKHSFSSSSSSDSDRCKRDCCQYVISSKDINNGKGVIIDKPGVWCLDGNACFNPKPSQCLPPDPRAVQAAITVKAGVSNVIIDLCSYRLSQAGSGTSTQTPYVIGILVPDPDPTNPDPEFVGAESIYIKGDDAIIDGFSMYGVRIFAHIYDVMLSNLTIKNCGLLAAKGTRPNANYFPHGSSVTGFGPSFGVAGLSIGESSALGMGPTFFTQNTVTQQNRLSQISLKNISCLHNFFNGLVLVNSTDVTINDCHFDDTFSNDPGIPGPNGYTVPLARGANFGFDSDINTANDADDPSILNMTVTNTTFNNTSLQGDFTTSVVFTAPPFIVEGVHEIASKETTYINCQFNNTSSTFVGGLVLNYGSARNEDGTFIDCSFDGAKGISGVQGFHRSGVSPPPIFTKSSRNLTLLNCTANNNQQIGDQQLPIPVVSNGASGLPATTGFNISFAKNVFIENCTASDNVINGPAGANDLAIGFDIVDADFFGAAPGQDSLSENIVLRNCVAARNSSVNGGQVLGFRFANATVLFVPVTQQTLRSISLENCIASGNVSSPGSGDVPGTQSIACGFYVQQNPQNDEPLFRSWPISFTGCKAMHNKGAISAASTIPTNGTIYSAGYYFLNADRHSLTDCEAIDNIYGIFLQQCDRCTVRNCRSDNNTDDVLPTGEGFTDIGMTGTPAVPTNSTSLFEANHAFANGTAAVHNGPNGNYNIMYNGAYASFPIITGSLTGGTFQTLPYTPVYNVSITQ